MQYFVSAENSSYFYWQLELLIESFLMQGLENELIIGLAENNSRKVKGFSSNLVKYSTKFIHANQGAEINYLPINRVNAIRNALASGILKFPFALIHADMILRNPITLSDDDQKYGVIVNNISETGGAEAQIVNETIDVKLEKIAQEKNIKPNSIPKIPFFSAPVVFTKSFENIAEAFFAQLSSNEMELIKEKGTDFPCELVAWHLTLRESFQHCSIKGKFMAANLLFDQDNINFIHYKTGIPPVFHKKYYDFSNGTFLTGEGPYEILLEHNPTINTNYVHDVIRSYNRRWKR